MSTRSDFRELQSSPRSVFVGEVMEEKAESCGARFEVDRRPMLEAQPLENIVAPGMLLARIATAPSLLFEDPEKVATTRRAPATIQAPHTTFCRREVLLARLESRDTYSWFERCNIAFFV
mmetsp:Transcript_28631/g.39907  ORF Transcript_28631/g.39907 Transcript_28631/m.39907 type:complete len:120 (+) Transcript_28631:827-1186(+)